MKMISCFAIIFSSIFTIISCANIKVNTINKAYKYEISDTLIVSINNNSKDSIRYYFSLECYFDKAWQEIDGDIFREPKQNKFFGTNRLSQSIIMVPLSNIGIDSIFMGKKFRIGVNVLPMNTLYYKIHYLPDFWISEN